MKIQNVKDALPAPVIPNATVDDNYTIDEYDVNAGITLIIPEYPDFHTGDIVKVFWGAVRSESYTLYDASMLPMEIDILSDWPPECSNDGSYDVYYTATDALGQNTNESEHVPLVIAAGMVTATLPAPVVPQGEDGVINQADALAGVDIQISYPGMMSGDVVTPTMNGYDAATDTQKFQSGYASHTVTDDEATALLVDLPTTVTESDLDAIGEDAYALFWYSVTPVNTTTVETSETLKVTVDVIPPGKA